ncbi:NhaA Na+/H+ antiporter [Candidatus Nanopelagicaceae bacterium]
MMAKRKSALRDFLDNESSSGIVILVAAALGLLVANSPISTTYFETLDIQIDLGQGALSLSLTVQKVINYVLMTLFFFVVGLEIKRELTSGHLASVKKALMPFIAALGGMAVPALIYLAIAGRTDAGGWGVPVATDIALAVGLLAMIGTSAPESLRSFLLALAVIDDIGAILIIAFVYSAGVAYSWLLASTIVILWILFLKKVGVLSTTVYFVAGALLWFALYKTGVHPTLAGVILGLLTPNIPRDESVTVIEWLEHKLHPMSSFIVVPIFAFANTGVKITSDTIETALSSVVAWGIFFGLVVGKPVGILVSSVAADRLKVADLPTGANKRLIAATGSAAGIGFTVSIFIAHLAFDNRQTEEIAILAIIVASIVSALISVFAFKKA